MSEKFENENEVDIDDIVIEDIDLQEIDSRNQIFGKEDDIFAEKKEQEGDSAAAKPEGPEEAAAEPAEESAETGEGPEEGEAESQKDSGQDPAPEIFDQPDDHPDGFVRGTGEADGEDVDEDEIPKGRRKRTKGDIIRYCVMFVALCVLVYSAMSLISIFLEYRQGEEIYEDYRKYATADPNQDKAPEYIAEEEPLNPNFQIASIDWNKLQADNSDVCAWIQFETLSQINYPVVQSTDNDYYLHHTTDHTENSAGSIFVESANKKDFSDMNTFVYGHNMKNGSMFGLLRYYKDASYYAGNEYFWIYTPQGNYRYKIFSCYEPLQNSETYTWWRDPCEEYTAYLSKVQSYSKYNTGVSVGPTDKIVTLSTCTSRGSDYRFVVHGKLVYSSAAQAAQTQPAAQAPAQ